MHKHKLHLISASRSVFANLDLLLVTKFIPYLFNIKLQNVLHVTRQLIDNGEVPKNRASMGNYNCPDGARCENGAPWNPGWSAFCSSSPYRFFDKITFFCRNSRMLSRGVEYYHEP